MPVFKDKNEDFFKKWSSEMAYVLGFILADGSLIISRRGAKYVEIETVDGDLLNLIKEKLNSDLKISERQRNKKWKKAYRLQIGSKEIFNDLLKLGIKPRKTGSETMPKVPMDYLRDFIRGYFDGDGSIWMGYAHKNRLYPTLALSLVFTSASDRLLGQIKRILENRLEIKGSQRYYGNAFRLCYSTFAAINLYNFLYGNGSSNLFLQRKKKKFEEYLKMK
ncbi:MAG: hypothetical protein COX90_02920 [Candidatus Nealsonbacteria bacterium CG_4_10_14_0_2_um_filter_38_17]|uniref:DOD-type homing endonuclease domain-containing protein n=2 Tax=Candidatus Nealsoniibacteriota TaxID=1817911 RepID=A0A2M7UXP5_9BACT|nr:MAG: hypothetical protein COX36_03040 [Candidatus Nealsonbacteria bacterium CG23_combo_of_CG06-09_8_20_14_all_38_19]PIZ88761.1 MAG: hypothetical protein COX90_02920 [Candidatus Nealsonbacteria bacterium CG_4_10_14_0_2_um_filter_38_17]